MRKRAKPEEPAILDVVLQEPCLAPGGTILPHLRTGAEPRSWSESEASEAVFLFFCVPGSRENASHQLPISGYF